MFPVLPCAPTVVRPVPRFHPLAAVQMPMTLVPYSEWIKNINDHTINGELPWDSTIRDAASPTPPHPLICSLSAGLRGDLQYPSSASSHVFLSSRRRSAQASSISNTTADGGDPFVELVSLAALAPPPRPPSAAVAKRQRLTRMRLEMLGDRKLRMARFLLEAAGSSGSAARIGGAQGGVRGGGRGGEQQRALFSVKSVNKTRRLLVLLVKVFGSQQRQRPTRGGDGAEGGDIDQRRDFSGPPAPAATTANHSSTALWDASSASPVLPPPPQLELRRDILALVRPVYSLLGQALLGEPGPARRLERQALAAAAALATAALEATRPQPKTGVVVRGNAANGERAFVAVPEAGGTTPVSPPDERRVAECFAQVVILAVATKLDTFLDAMGGGGDQGEELQALQQPQALADFGTREIELERLLRGMGAWDVHGDARGWPHHVPPLPTQSDTAVAAAMAADSARGDEEKAGEDGGEVSDAPLSSLLAGADEMVEAFKCELAPAAQRNPENEQEGTGGGRWWQRVQDALLPRIAACRLELSGRGAGQS